MNDRPLARRIERLEKHNRRMMILTAALLAGAVLPWVLGAAEDVHSQTLRARRFLLVDGNNRLRVFLGADEDEEGRTGLYLYDQLGKRSAALYVKKGHSGLALYGENNKQRARLELGPSEVGLTLYDAQSDPRAQLAHDLSVSRLTLGPSAGRQDTQPDRPTSTSNPNLTISFDAANHGRSLIRMGSQEAGAHIELNVNPAASHVLLRNQAGDARIQLAPSADQPSLILNALAESPAITVVDAQGRIVSHLP